MLYNEKKKNLVIVIEKYFSLKSYSSCKGNFFAYAYKVLMYFWREKFVEMYFLREQFFIKIF